MNIFIPLQFPGVDVDDVHADVNNNSDVSSKTSESIRFGTKPIDRPSKSTNRKPTAIKLPQIPELPKDSSYYGDDDDDVAQRCADEDLAIPIDLPFHDDQPIVKVSSFRRSTIASTRKRAASPSSRVQSTSKVVKSVNANKLSLYDFHDDSADEPVMKKPRGRGRARTTQPKKRAKPLPFPRTKLPSVERSVKKYTIRPKTPVGKVAKKLKMAGKSVNVSSDLSLSVLDLIPSKEKIDQPPTTTVEPPPIKQTYDRAAKRKKPPPPRQQNTPHISEMGKLGMSIKRDLPVKRRSNGKIDESKQKNRDSNTVSQFA